MAALPYIQLYVADYLADTVHLSTEEHGAYMLLIFNYWQTGKPIPKDRLESITKLPNGRWTDVERTLNEFFIEGENGEWIHPRIDEDLERVKAKSDQASKAGKASAVKRKGSKRNGRSTSTKKPVQRPVIYTDTETDTETEVIETISQDKNPDVEEIIQEYRDFKKGTNGVTKGLRERLGCILKERVYSKEDLLMSVRRYCGDCQKTDSFIKNPDTFFGKRERHYEAFIIDYQPPGIREEKEVTAKETKEARDRKWCEQAIADNGGKPPF